MEFVENVPCDLAREILERVIMPMWDGKEEIRWGIMVEKK